MRVVRVDLMAVIAEESDWERVWAAGLRMVVRKEGILGDFCGGVRDWGVGNEGREEMGGSIYVWHGMVSYWNGDFFKEPNIDLREDGI